MRLGALGILKKMQQQREWMARYGHIRPCISTDHHGQKVVAVGNRLCWSPKWKFIPDFLMDYIPAVFGADWGKEELAKAEHERHPLAQWRVDGVRFMNAQPRQADGGFCAIPSGPLMAYMGFAFNLFAIEDNGRLDSQLLARLKNKDQFQGARHEVFAEATCIRAGFSIEHENEKDGAQRHAEFTAKHLGTGLKFSIEAKSRHRAGVLGFPGAPQPHEKLSLRFGGLLNDAIAKNPPFLLVVFIDTNLPYHSAEKVLTWDAKENKPSRIMCSLLDRDRKEHGGKDLYAMLVFTNHPHHYGDKNAPDHRHHLLAIVPEAIRGVTRTALFDLYQAANLYRNIPNEFPEQ